MTTSALLPRVGSRRASRVSGQAGETAAPSGNTIASATLTGVAGNFTVIGGVSWSLSVAPAAALALTLKDNGTIIRQWFVTAAGPGQLVFDIPITTLLPGKDLVLALAADSGGASATVNFDSSWLEVA